MDSKIEKWLDDQDKRIKYAGQIKELVQNEALRAIITDMIETKARLLFQLETEQEPEKIKEIVLKRKMIAWFVNSFYAAINAGEIAEKQLAEYKKKEGSIARKNRFPLKPI